MRGRYKQLLTSQCEGLSWLSKWDTRAGDIKWIAPKGRANRGLLFLEADTHPLNAG